MWQSKRIGFLHRYNVLSNDAGDIYGGLTTNKELSLQNNVGVTKSEWKRRMLKSPN